MSLPVVFSFSLLVTSNNRHYIYKVKLFLGLSNQFDRRFYFAFFKTLSDEEHKYQIVCYR